jgi:hypothetical protein
MTSSARTVAFASCPGNGYGTVSKDNDVLILSSPRGRVR